MVSLLMLVIVALWAAVLVPPLVRDRLENRSNSSVSDFRQQLSSLQRAMPTRGNVRTMGARPLAPSALSRPAAPGRPGMRGAVGIAPRRGRGVSDATLRGRTHGDPTAGLDRRRVEALELKRRRTNVLAALAITAVGSGIFAFSTDSKAMMAVFAVTVMAISAYMFVLAQDAQTRQLDAPRERADRRVPAGARRHGGPAPRQRRDDRRRAAADRWDDADAYGEYDDVYDEPARSPRRRPAAASAAAFDPGMRRRDAVARDEYDEYQAAPPRQRPVRVEQIEYVDEQPAAKPARRGKLTMPPTVVPPSVGGGAIDPLLPSWRAAEPVAEAPVADDPVGTWRDDNTETISSVTRNGDGSGASGRISYGRNKFSRLGGADGYTMPAPRGDVAGRDADWVARSITPARNGRHATGQNPVLRRTPAAH